MLLFLNPYSHKRLCAQKSEMNTLKLRNKELETLTSDLNEEPSLGFDFSARGAFPKHS